MDGRAAIALLLMLAFAGTAWGLARPDLGAPDGEFAVFVVGTSGLLHNGTVEVEDATELRVLQVLAAQRGFTVEVDDLPGCAMDYVRGINGVRETSSGGWNFYVRDAGEWEWVGRSAACPGLREGQDVLWCWVEPDERCAVDP